MFILCLSLLFLNVLVLLCEFVHSVFIGTLLCICAVVRLTPKWLCLPSKMYQCQLSHQHLYGWQIDPPKKRWGPRDEYKDFILGNELLLLLFGHEGSSSNGRHQVEKIYACQQGGYGRGPKGLQNWDQSVGQEIQCHLGHPAGNGSGNEDISREYPHHEDAEVSDGVHGHPENLHNFIQGTHVYYRTIWGPSFRTSDQ